MMYRQNGRARKQNWCTEESEKEGKLHTLLKVNYFISIKLFTSLESRLLFHI